MPENDAKPTPAKERRNLDGMNKTLFKGSMVFAEIVAHSAVAEYLDSDLSNFRNLQADYLARLKDGSYLQIEFQTNDDRMMPIRLKLYEKEIKERFGRDIKLMQVVLRTKGKPGLVQVDRAFTHSYYEMVLDDVIATSLMASQNIEDNMIAGFYAGENEKHLHLEILDRISHIPDDKERSEHIGKFGMVLSYRQSIDPEVSRRLKEIAMEAGIRIEGNPVFEIVFDKGKLEGKAEGKAEGILIGEARGILIGKALSHGAPDEVIQKIREWNGEDLSELSNRFDDAARDNDWSSFTDEAATPRA